MKSKAGIGRCTAGFCLLVLAGCRTHQASVAPAAVEAIRTVIAKYAKSVDNADTDLARVVWADDPAISFIHARGHERGWTEIKSNFYEKTMRDLFSSRKLSVRDIAIKVYGEAAVAEFY